MNKILLALAGTLLAVAPVSSAAALFTLNPGDKLIISFIFSSPPVCTGECDVLFGVVPVGAANFVTSQTESLYDGATLLSTHTGGCCQWSFHSASSPFITGGVADFTAIVNGTIQGRIEYTIANGQLTGIDLSGVSVSAGHATSECCLSVGTAASVSASIEAVPEPALGGLLAAALAILALVNRRQIRKEPLRPRSLPRS